jgi:predicted nucleic acid-binding protein
VPALVQQHEFHARSFAALDRVQNGKDEGFISAHGLAELYAVLTSLPQPFRHAPEQALLSIEENILKHFKVSALTGNDYASLIREAAFSAIQGGTIYDAVLIKCAVKAEVDRIYTLNLKHFQNIAPKNIVSKIVSP